ncbi:Guanine nucleotide-binding protein G(o) subunit alpha [Labeo rohita]|uniref:Guanine nucleotide-binding protein G(O) subunit alpha n=1 Tax=Labeo rohita TaxID=84645 RepID=A0ABQ8LIL9_LABRO|nr:Guanine nucleotide-binding protein G(o) subunit alpha [Labeo rohita]
MGLCLGSEVTEEGKKAKIHSSQIDRDLYEYAKREMNVVKILMLGAAESGKSTLVKQMKIIHSHGFTKQELASFKEIDKNASYIRTAKPWARGGLFMNTKRLFGVRSSPECSAPLIYGPANKSCSIKGRNVFALARESGAPAVLDNLLTSMKFVLHGMGVLRVNLANSKNKVHAHSVLSCGRCFDEEQMLFPFIGHALCCLWADQGVRSAAARGYEYELNDSAL